MKFITRFASSIFLLTALLFSSALTALESNPALVVETPAYPLFNLSQNEPVFRLKVIVPVSSESVQVESFKMIFGSATWKYLDKATIFYTGDEPEYVNPVGISSAPVSKPLSVGAATITLKPGIHYFWISVTSRTGQALRDSIVMQSCSVSTIIKQKRGELIWGKSAKRLVGSLLAKTGQDSVHTYRIPGIVATSKATLIAVYDFRYRNASDLPGDIDVGMRRSTDGGLTWHAPKVIMDMGEPHKENGVGDPAILYDPATHTIWVAALWSKGNRSIAGSGPGLSPDSTGQIVLTYSKDDGETWAKPFSITSQVKQPNWHIYFIGPGAGITMRDGTLVFATQYWDESAKPGIPHSSIIYSKDHGKTWQSGKGVRSNTNESQVIETSPGTLMINMRDNRGQYRSVATTKDIGKNWTLHPNSYSTFKDPVCMASFTKLELKVGNKVKPVVLFSNVEDSYSRVKMTIKASMDLGETWQEKNKLLIDERRSYGYSCIVGIDQTTIGVLYEGRGDIYFVRIPIHEIIK
jgi:sialidase-1